MSGTTRLSPKEWPMLLQLSDPETAAPPIPLSDSLPRLLLAADQHGLLPIVLRKLTGNPAWKLALDRSGALTALREKHEVATGLTMLLEHYHIAIRTHLQRHALRAVVVKGPTFANALYREIGDRPFSDIDILAHPADADGVAQMLAAMGFERFRKKFWDRSNTYQEQKWLHVNNPNLMIELHNNLVHYPTLRRGISFGYDDYRRACLSGQECPMALFMTAIVHGSLGHKFHKLQLLVDVLQAFRHLSDEQMSQLPAVADNLSLRLETSLCLKRVSDMFGVKNAGDMADRLALPIQSQLAAALVTPQSLLATHGTSRLRRHAFRWLQSLHIGR